MSLSLTNLTDLLRRRSAQAILSLWSPASPTLRAALESRLESWPGEAEALLSSPVFEHRFEYARDPRAMSALPPELISPALIDAMDREWPTLEEQRFARTWRPYVHQVQAWTALRSEQARSVVVATGTGSGKTECFLVPILDHLARSPGVRHQGVQALMLYPLNALIESQRERFSAWTRHFGGDIRYCLYNGDTPQGVQPSRKYRAEPERVHDRTTLRQDPPPLLVTNSTMLEYMLVRPEDDDILRKSQGKLRYVVIDEAHTYLGSQAAELALLLRRVLLAFGVRPGDVRFIATSATIGGPEAKADLKRFLSRISGQPESRVDVIDGRPGIPCLPDCPDRDVDLPALAAMPDEQRYDALASWPPARRLRDRVAKEPTTLTELTRACLYRTDVDAQRRTLELLDLAHRARSRDGSFLPLRAHFQVRTLPGLWTCADPACPCRGGLDGRWPFGAIYLQPRPTCACGRPVYPIATCVRCGAEYLEGRYDVREQTFRPPALNPLALLDEPTVDTGEEDAERPEDRGEDEDEAAGETTAWLRPDNTGNDTLDLDHLRVGRGTLKVTLVEFPPVADDVTTCACCGNPQRNGQPPFRTARIGTPFMLGVVLPAVLDELPVPDPKRASELPAGGRRLITFTDSRQGSARFAAIQQGEVERGFVRSLLYQTAWAQAGGSSADRAQLEADIADLRRELADDPPDRYRRRFETDLRAAEGKLAALSDAGVPLRAVARILGQEQETTWLYNERARHATFRLRQEDLPELLLLREFARRPMRRTSLEAMGLVGLRYPALAKANAPTSWLRLGGTDESWRDYLKLCVDYFIRQNLMIDMPREWREWLGIPMRTHLVVGQGGERTSEVIPWPSLHPTRRPHRLAGLILGAYKLDQGTHHPEVNDLLDAAWRDIHQRLLRARGAGWYLDLFDSAELVPRRQVHLCPATRAAIDTILGGRSPFQPLPDPDHPLEVASATCRPVDLPRPPLALGGEAPDLDGWLRTDQMIRNARDLGLWTEFHDRVVAFQQLYFLREHSAQIPGERLREYTDKFKSGVVNVLSCSTTMEMGVDIGNLQAVVMNNVPPAPANYRQRAGRAGRRKESVAIAVTVARALPHDQMAFADPTRAFTRPMHVASVSLDRVRIVQRHVNARVLNAFLVVRAPALKLTCAAFYFTEEPLYSGFLEWLDGAARTDRPLADTLAALVQGTALQGWRPAELLDQVKEAAIGVHSRLAGERGALLEHRGRLPEDSAGSRALGFQIDRLDGEYLLSWLASVQFLPGYGMPTDLVPFVNVTVADLEAERRRRAEAAKDSPREARRGRSRDYPTYDAALALRAYAPGSTVVVDGLAYRSGGVTLNWKLPADAGKDETQSIKEARVCSHCGFVQVAHRPESTCSQCGGATGSGIRFLEPAGFAVDLYEAPTTDVGMRTWIPVEEPMISAGDAAWVSVAGVVTMRHSPEGVIFHQSRGEHRHGYALCLRCGRAEPEREPFGLGEVPKGLVDHRRLQGGKNDNPDAVANRCDGRPGTFAIQRGIMFGAHQATDVFELRLQDPTTGPVRDVEVATTLAVGLRDALAEHLGVDSDEIGFGLGTWKQADGTAYTICLFDAAVGGAGFVAEAAGCIAELLAAVRKRLDGCSCQRACEKCLLDADTQHHLKNLDRNKALAFLRQALLDALAVPKRHPGARWEWQPPAGGLLREVRINAARSVRLWAGAEGELDLQRWRAHPLLGDLRRARAAVELVFPPGSVRQLDSMDARLLRGMCEEIGDSPRWTVSEGEAPTGVWAEVSGTRALWLCCERENGFNEDWLEGEGPWLVRGAGAASTRPVLADELERAPSGFVREVIIQPSELACTARELGNRLMELVARAEPALASLSGPARRIAIIDRYLKSPANVGNLYSLLEAFERRGWLDTRTALVVATIAVRSPERASTRVSVATDWDDPTHQDGVLRQLLGRFPNVTIDVRTRAADLAHQRSIALAWDDGRSLTVMPDQGLSLVRPMGSVPFQFRANAAEQASEIMRLRWGCEAASSAATVVYSKVE